MLALTAARIQPVEEAPVARCSVAQLLSLGAGLPGGPEALAVNRRLVAAKDARLEFDAAPRDSWGRLLAYVWIRRLLRIEP